MANPARKVLLVGWDAADWKVIHPLMDAGKMPTVKRLVEGGSMANLATLHPVLSPMLWTSIATGKRPFKHGIHGFTEPTPDGHAIQPITNLSRNTKAIWNILTQQGFSSHVVGWWPSHPAEPIRGAMVSNHFQRAVGPPSEAWPLPAGAVHPVRLGETLAALRLNPNELLAEHILPFIPRAAEIDQKEDRRLASCAKILAECTTVHAAATWLMKHEPWDFMAVYYDAIDHFCHGFMRYHPPRQEHVPEAEFELYKGVVEAGYRYHDMMLNTLLQMAGPDVTVMLISDHGFHPDHLRPRVIPAEPAGPALEHRDFGIFVIHGPDIKADTLLHGLNLLDIVPTLLTVFGLPIGADMDGQAILEAFETCPKITTIASWDEVAGEAGLHPQDLQLNPVEAQEAVQQLVALGYIEPPGPDHEKAIDRTVRELRYNLARAYMDDSRHVAAAEILEELYLRWPNEHRFGVQLATCYQALDRIADLRLVVEDLSTRRRVDAEQAREELRQFLQELHVRREQRESQPQAGATPAESSPAMVEELAQLDLEMARDVPAAPPAPQPLLSQQEWHRYRDLRSRSRYNPHAIDYLWGYVALAEGDYERALSYLLASEKLDAQRPGLHLQIGEAYLNLRRAEDAERSYQRAIAIDPENPHAHLGLCRSYLLRRENQRAAEAALRSIGLLYQHPMAHYRLAVALHRMDRILPAVEALQVAISLNPNFPEAHQRLVALYRNRLGDPNKAAEHRKLAAEMRLARRQAVAASQRYQSSRVGGQLRHREDDADLPTTPKSTAESKEIVTPSDPDKYVTVVSGLPRSGTSLVMQMLAAGGMTVLSDGRREADDSNPRGYFEYQRVKNLKADNAWLGESQGKAVKIIVQLMPYVPPGYRYRVVVVERDLDEIVASQRAMLEREGRSGAQISDAQLKRVFAAQSSRVRRWMQNQGGIDVLTVHHRQLIENPALPSAQIAEFLDGQVDVELMAKVVDMSLYRSRR